MKYSDFIDTKYFLRNSRLKGPYCSKKIASSKSEISEKSLKQKSVTKSHSKFSCEIVLEFQTLITIT